MMTGNRMDITWLQGPALISMHTPVDELYLSESKTI